MKCICMSSAAAADNSPSLSPPVPVSILTVCLPQLPSPSSETWHWHLKCQSDVHSYRNPFSACHLPLNRDSHFPAAYPHFLYPSLLRPCLIYLSDNQLETPLGPIILAPSIKIGANCQHVFCTEMEMENVSK